MYRRTLLLAPLRNMSYMKKEKIVINEIKERKTIKFDINFDKHVEIYIKKIDKHSVDLEISLDKVEFVNDKFIA
tara:strand:- start:365 stop:586 length:222 start_codon:yes stop_codon:yes gene_type:complete